MPGNPQNLLVSVELVSSNGQEMGVEAEKDELYVSGGKMLFGRTLQQTSVPVDSGGHRHSNLRPTVNALSQCVGE